ncbi:MAG: hypothetical protein HY791_37105 [Deltaproteobacteria bacterium]|nr:hypothetical protein [Deltaproteobacteria bacterium]
MDTDKVEKQKRVLPLFLAAGTLFVVTFSIPQLPKHSPELAERFGLGTQKGKVGFELLDAHGLTLSATVTAGSKFGIRYEGAGYIYLWLVELEAPGKVKVILPRPTDGGLPWGMRIPPAGGAIPELAEIGPGRRVFYALFSPVPIRLDEIETALGATGTADSLAAAESLRLRGYSVVKVVRGE